MASVQLKVVDIWPAGTLVGAYIAREQPSQLGAPVGVAAETATVAADGTLTFADLADGEHYIGFALGRTRRFSIGAGAGITGVSIVAAVGQTTLKNGLPGRRWRVLSYTLVADGVATAEWRSGASPISGAMSFAANGGAAPEDDGGLIETAPGAALVLNVTGNTVRGHARVEPIGA